MKSLLSLAACCALTLLPSCEMLSDPAFMQGLSQGLQQVQAQQGGYSAPTIPAYRAPTPVPASTKRPAPSPRQATAPRPSSPKPRASSGRRPSSTQDAAPARPMALVSVWEFINKKGKDRWGFTGPLQKGLTFFDTQEEALKLAGVKPADNLTLVSHFDHRFTPQSQSRERHYHVYVYKMNRPLTKNERDIRSELSRKYGYAGGH